jgi:hypothetical protein
MLSPATPSQRISSAIAFSTQLALKTDSNKSKNLKFNGMPLEDRL